MIEQAVDWRHRAACRAELDFDRVFYPAGKSKGYTPENTRTARLWCAQCPVIEECRADVDELEHGQPLGECHGVWAGEDPKERIVRRRRARGARPGPGQLPLMAVVREPEGCPAGRCPHSIDRHVDGFCLSLRCTSCRAAAS